MVHPNIQSAWPVLDYRLQEKMKKFTGIVIIMALVLMQKVDQTEGFGEFSDRIMINKYISHAFAKNEDPKDQHPCIELLVMKNLHILPVSANSA